ncbi:MAG: hypothetical protein GWP25_05245, partial [Euryarchaeota archaeon]|nr:hypothetical protein [Euryarchaeota archaeon]
MTDKLLGFEGKRKALFLVICMLLAIVPLTPVSAEDIGEPSDLQAQDINAFFDPISESTTVTWRNIDIDNSILQGLLTSEYSVYRSDQPITDTSILSLVPFETNITACELNVGEFPEKCRGINGTNGQHSASFLVP